MDEVLVGDAIALMAGLPEASFDLVFADPPYNLQLAHELTRPEPDARRRRRGRVGQVRGFRRL